MLVYFLSKPGIYLLIGLTLVIFFIFYWKRQFVFDEIKQWRAKEFSIGSFKFERQHMKNEDIISSDESGDSNSFTSGKHGVIISGDFQRARISKVAGRDISSNGIKRQVNGRTPGVVIGQGDFSDADLREIAGRDISETEE